MRDRSISLLQAVFWPAFDGVSEGSPVPFRDCPSHDAGSKACATS